MPGLEKLTPAQRAVADEALRDLDLSLTEMPDSSLGPDFAYLANAIRVLSMDAVQQAESR